MANIESHIAGSQKLIDIFGRWPSFHDAEVVELNFWRGQVKPGVWDDRTIMPVLTAKIHIWIALATLRFEGVDASPCPASFLIFVLQETASISENKTALGYTRKCNRP